MIKAYFWQTGTVRHTGLQMRRKIFFVGKKMHVAFLRRYSNNLVLHFNKIKGGSRDRFKKKNPKSKQQRQRYPNF